MSCRVRYRVSLLEAGFEIVRTFLTVWVHTRFGWDALCVPDVPLLSLVQQRDQSLGAESTARVTGTKITKVKSDSHTYVPAFQPDAVATYI